MSIASAFYRGQSSTTTPPITASRVKYCTTRLFGGATDRRWTNDGLTGLETS